MTFFDSHILYNFTEHVWLTELAIEKVFDRDFIPIFAIRRWLSKINNVITLVHRVISLPHSYILMITVPFNIFILAVCYSERACQHVQFSTVYWLN